MRAITSFIFLIWFYGALAVVGLGFAPAALIDKRFIWIAMRWWGNAALFGLRWICGVRVIIEGREHLPKGAALIASKHQATLDTLLPAQFVTEPVFVVKRELIHAPVFGFYMKHGMIHIDRGENAKALREMLRAARDVIAKGRQIVIYPEGTRQALGAPPDYKPGIAALYRDLNLPVTPIALNTGLVWPPQGFMRKPGVVTIKILPAIPTGLSREAFMAELERRIETECQALLAPHRHGKFGA